MQLCRNRGKRAPKRPIRNSAEASCLPICSTKFFGSAMNSEADAATPSQNEDIRLSTGIRAAGECDYRSAVLAAMSLLPLLEIAGRSLIGRGVPGSIPLVQHLTLWIAFLGAALAARSNKLLALSTAEFLPQRWIQPVRILLAVLAVGIAGSLLAGSLDLVRVERASGGKVAIGIPVWVALSIMPAGWALVAGRLIWNASGNWRGRLLAVSGLMHSIPVWISGTASGKRCDPPSKHRHLCRNCSGPADLCRTRGNGSLVLLE